MNHEEWDNFIRKGEEDRVWKAGEPSEYERQFQKLSMEKGVNHNWLESEAYRAGIDVDHIRGYDDGEPFKSKEE